MYFLHVSPIFAKKNKVRLGNRKKKNHEQIFKYTAYHGTDIEKNGSILLSNMLFDILKNNKDNIFIF